MPIRTQVVTGSGDETVRICCSSVRPTSASGLRCRFGKGVEVEALIDDDGVSCCLGGAAARGLCGESDVPVQVLQHDTVLAEDSIPADELFVQLLRKSEQPQQQPSACCPPGACRAVEVQPAQPAADGGGDGIDPSSVALAVDVAAAGGLEAEVGRSETRKEAMARTFSALKPFVIISLSYLLFTTTDGAVRMIVLLHAYTSGFTAWEVALMFTLYELAGVVTNLAAGMMGAKWGIKWTLLSGLTLQLAGIGMLYGWSDDWSLPGNKIKGIIYVTFAQMLCGIAKDLTKLGGKTVTKLVTKDEQQSKLFKLVSFITGFKNSLKGAGYFIGATSVAFNYNFALGLLLFLILLAMPWAAVGLSSQLGRTRKENLTLRRIFKQNYNISVLSLSRFFLFGSRDMWFEVPLPFFLRDKVQGLGWSRPLTGLFLALWIIAYGQVQSWTPQLVLGPLRQMPANKYVAVVWNAVLVATPLFMAAIIQGSDIFTGHDQHGMMGVMIGGLGAFCLIFAINSSIHSYLIVRYAEGDKVAMNVGFYYMANAMGRLTGTLVSGALYSYAGGGDLVKGFAACFWASLGFCVLSAVIEIALKDNSAGLLCGRITIVEPDANAAAAAPVEVEAE